MNDTAVPEETRRRVDEMAPAELVIGVPGYRNARAIGDVVERVAQGVERHYPHLHPVLVHADGHSHDETLSGASRVPLPSSIRRVVTRSQGVPGRGTALRAVFEISAQLHAHALLIVDADTISLEPEWIPQLLEPVLAKQLDFVLPVYQHVHPPPATADLLISPFLSALFGISARYPTAGEAAMAGGVAAFFAARDVWETDVAHEGIDVWMTAEAALEGGRVGQVYLSKKVRRDTDSVVVAENKFLKEIGTLFRLAQLHQRAWRHSRGLPKPVTTLGEPLQDADPEPAAPVDVLQLWQHARRLAETRVLKLWEEGLREQHAQTVEALLEQGENNVYFDDHIWARLVYDSAVEYNLGEGDPDKVVAALYPLFLLRQSAWLLEAEGVDDAFLTQEKAVQRQRLAFNDELPRLHRRWQRYSAAGLSGYRF